MSHLKECQVTIEADLGANNQVQFELHSQYKKNGGLSFNNRRKDDYYLVTFKLDDDTRLGLKFPPNASDAIWVARNRKGARKASCPSRRGTVPDVQPLYVTPSGRELVVFNRNANKQKLGFRLNFLDSSVPPNQYKHDPPWENGNGGAR